MARVDTSGSGTGGSQTAIEQVAHGLAVGDVVGLSGSATYTAAQADVAANAGVAGIVSAVADADHFTLQTSGRVTGLSGLAADTVYYLDPASAGGLTATEPTTAGNIWKPILYADTTTSGYIINLGIGLVLPAAATFPIGVKVTDDSTALTTGEGKVGIPIFSRLNGLNLTSVKAGFTTASSSGAPSIGIRRTRSGSDVEMLSTNLTVDANELTSETAATAAVIDTANDDLATGDIVWIDIDTAGTGAKGLFVELEAS